VTEPGRRLRTAAILFGCYFLFAAVVQLNDPDALAWGGFYLAAAAVSISSVRRLPPAWLPRTLAAIAAVWAAVLAPAAFGASFRELFQSWQMMSAGMEIGREFLGLVVLVGWMLVLGARAARSA
jgi:hypothetical protein